MGLDGGTIISRSDVLRGSSWRMSQADRSRSTRGGTVSSSNVYQEQQLDQQTQKEVAWGSCALSGQPLKAPVVADPAGQLLNKDAALELLLGRKGAFADTAAEHRYANLLRSSGAGAWDHVSSLKDLVTVQLPPAHTHDSTTAPHNSSSGGSSGGAGSTHQQQVAPGDWVCPVTLLPCMHHPSSLLKPCGHVISNKALVAITASAAAADDDHAVGSSSRPLAAPLQLGGGSTSTGVASGTAAAQAGVPLMDGQQLPQQQQQLPQQQQQQLPQQQLPQQQQRQQQQQQQQDELHRHQPDLEQYQGLEQQLPEQDKVQCEHPDVEQRGATNSHLALLPYTRQQQPAPDGQLVKVDPHNPHSTASSTSVCPVCSTPFTSSQVLLLNGSAQQRQQMRTQHLARAAGSKKGKKRARTPG